MSVWPARLGLLALAIVAIAVRCHGLSHTLGFDEAWVANSLREPTWRQMFHYEAWAQTTPPGFLTLARASVAVLGTSNLALHLLAFVMGLAGVAVITWLGWRELSPTRGLWMGLLAAISGPQVAFAKEAKQYSAEFLVAALLLFLTRVSARAFAWGPPLALGGAFAFGPGMLAFLPAALLAWRPPWRIAALWVAGTGVAAAVLLALLYWPNRSPALFGFWASCFPNADDLGSLTRVASLDLRMIFSESFHAAAPDTRWSLAAAGRRDSRHLAE